MDRFAEWLEPDGLGGFASGTVNGIRTRRYHALLLAALRPPTERVVLVNGFDAWVDTTNGRFALSSQAYQPDVIYPDGMQRLESFELAPWSCWKFRLEDGTQIEQEIFVRHGSPLVVLTWRILEGKTPATLSVRPFLSGRDYHGLHHENPAFNFEPRRDEQKLMWCPYPGIPGIGALTNAEYTHDPHWYRNLLYAEERNRGLDDTEDLASPGFFTWNLRQGEASLILTVEGQEGELLRSGMTIDSLLKSLKVEEAERRESFPSRLHLAADAYLVNTNRARAGHGTSRPIQEAGGWEGGIASEDNQGKTIVAGYPWFTDWGRDTFIALRGLCIATGRLEEARQILLEWADAVSEGMLPNRFPDRGEAPEFNSVDASLWYVVAVQEYVQAMEAKHLRISLVDRKRLHEAVEAILSGYAAGTRYGIRLDDDGLLAAGVPGAQLTWMDAKIGNWVVTPRIGKPVEVQALWLNAVGIAGGHSKRWADLYAQGLKAFRTRFWSPAGYLYDVIDVDHQRSKMDVAFRPNQIFAVGGLPLALLEEMQAQQVVDAVESRLWTPVGLRSLAPGEPGYAPRYEGGVHQRDSVYHQGTVWPWLIGPFVEAWVRVRGNSPQAKQQARKQFLEPLFRHLHEAGLGHVSEIADADAVHIPRGCPFQAWSVGELLRLDQVVLAK